VRREASFDVVNESEVLICFVDGNNIHESSWKAELSANFSVHLYQALLTDHPSFVVCQRVLQTVSQEENERQRLTKLVRSTSRSRRKRAAHFVQHPFLWGG